MNIRYSTEDFCSICYGPYEESSEHDAVRLDCQHAFGRKCIVSWALAGYTCPVCGLETIPEEFTGRKSLFRRLANRTISGLAPEQKIGLALGVFISLYVGSMVAVNYKIHPDSAIGNGVDSLLAAAAGAAGCRAFFSGRDPRGLFSSSYLLGAVIGLGLSALIMSIATTPVQSN